MYKNKINNKKFLNVLILCALIFTLTFQMIPGLVRKDLSNNLRTSAEYDPAGIIAMWSGPLSAIPAGWKLSDGTDGTINTTNRFVYSTGSMESPGATGGSTSHDHAYSAVPYHDHGVAGTTSTPHRHTYTQTDLYTFVGPGIIPYTAIGIGAGTTGADSASHNHGGYTFYTGGTGLYMSEEEDFIPPYYEMAFIEKETNDPTIPIGLIVMWAGNINDIPAGWELCNGSSGTPDLRERFIRGAPSGEDPGTLGGNVNHNHAYNQIPSHRHSIDTGGASHSHTYTYGSGLTRGALIWSFPVYTSATGYTSYETYYHTHPVPTVGQVSCTSQNTANLPPYFKVAFIMNTVVSDALPLGVISMWGDSISDIPSGWNQCNGTNNTPNLLNRFPRGVATGEQPGIIDGSATHRHGYTQVPIHTHTIPGDDMRHRHTYRTIGSLESTIIGFDGVFMAGGVLAAPTFTSSPSHNHDINPTGDSPAYTAYATSLPPYVKIIYMKKGLSLYNPSPQDGATDISYDPTLTVNVNDLEGDDLIVSFYNASDDSLIDSDVVLGGSGSASVTWSGLSSGTSYSWYIKADDGLGVHQSDTWSFTTNYGSNVPTNPTPNDGAIGISYSPTLSVDVSDDDGDDLTVSFYDASDDSLIDADVVLGGSGSASVTWAGLLEGTSYSWYAISDDGLSTTQSAPWSFTTNYVPYDPTNPVPSDNALDVEVNPTLSVSVFDVDAQDLTVTFYNASDDSLIDTNIVLGGSGTASVTWSGVSSNMNCTWYAIADDGISTTQSLTWTFSTTIEENGGGAPPGIPLPGLIPLGLIVIGTTGILSVITYLRRKKLE